MFVGATDLGDITFRAPDLLTPGGWTFDASTVLANLQSEAFQFSLLLEGLDAVAAQLEEALANVPADKNLPLIGTSVTAGADVVHRFRTGVLDPIQALVNQLTGAPDADDLAGIARNFFFSQLGPAGPVPILRDGPDGNTTITANDVGVELDCKPPAGAVRACQNGDALNTLQRFEVFLPLGEQATATAPPFDFGFPGLRLASDGTLSASAGFEIDLRFGIDRTNGFYIGTTGANELRVFAAAGLPNNAGGPDLEGELAFLPVTIEDAHPGPDVIATAGIDIAGGGADGRLTLQQLDTVTLTPSISACGNLSVDLELTAPLEAASSLPKLLARLNVIGGYTSASVPVPPACGGTPGTFTIGFDNVRVDVGTLLEDFLGPVAHEIRKFTGPLEPVVEALRKPIPGVADAARMAGLPEPVWYDLFKVVNDLNMAAGGQNGLEFIDRLIVLIDLVQAFDEQGPEAGVIPLGDFDVNAALASQPVPSEVLDTLLMNQNSQGSVAPPPERRRERRARNGRVERWPEVPGLRGPEAALPAAHRQGRPAGHLRRWAPQARARLPVRIPHRAVPALHRRRQPASRGTSPPATTRSGCAGRSSCSPTTTPTTTASSTWPKGCSRASTSTT